MVLEQLTLFRYIRIHSLTFAVLAMAVYSALSSSRPAHCARTLQMQLQQTPCEWSGSRWLTTCGRCSRYIRTLYNSPQLYNKRSIVQHTLHFSNCLASCHTAKKQPLQACTRRLAGYLCLLHKRRWKSARKPTGIHSVLVPAIFSSSARMPSDAGGKRCPLLSNFFFGISNFSLSSNSELCIKIVRSLT